MGTNITTQESLTVLLKTAPLELREVLTRQVSPRILSRALGLVCSGCGAKSFRGTDYITHEPGCGDRVTLPVPEATLAAMQWWPMSKPGRTIHVVNNRGAVLYSAIDHDGKNQHWYDGSDIFAAIRAALEA